MAHAYTVGREADPARRLRQEHGALIRKTRQFRGWNIEDLVDAMAGQGTYVTKQAVSFWERGETSPRPHHQLAVARALSVPHAVLFPMNAEAA